MENKNTYESGDVVLNYYKSDYLHYPEKNMLAALRPGLHRMKMLDVGTGAGRTSFHFAPLVKEYIGIDYSQNMVDACKRRFKRQKGKISFRLCDARNMDIFEDNSFDFILVSSNALDYISHEDRIKSLNEIRRVGKKRAILLFSSHNLQTLDRLLEIKFSPNPIKLLKSVLTHILLRAINKNFFQLRKKKYATLNDGAHRFRLSTYYIKPKEQIAQLESAGFKKIKVYSSEDGTEITKQELETTDKGVYHGLYYLCKM